MVNKDDKRSPTHKANTLTRATTENRETCLVNLPLAGTFQEKVFYTRKLKHSLNRRLELRRAVMQKGPKIGRRPLWDDQSAVTRADPVVLVSPILGQGVNA